jgi:hypothetical protein
VAGAAEALPAEVSQRSAAALVSGANYMEQMVKFSAPELPNFSPGTG